MGWLRKPRKYSKHTTQISTTIPTDLYLEIKKNRWKINDLVIIGAQAKKGMPKILDRLRETEQGNDKLQAKITQLSVKLIELEDQQMRTRAERG